MEDERTPAKHPRERKADKQPISKREFTRDLWLLLITGFVFFAITVAIRGSDKAKQAAHDASRITTGLEVLVVENRKLALDAKALAIKFQNQRIENIRNNCRTTNKRHDNTIKALDRALKVELKNLPKGQVVTKEQIKANRDSTIFIIDALQPHQDCKLLVARAQGTTNKSASTKPPKVALPPIIPNPDNHPGHKP